ncbi:UDP-N-acetyl-D-glucosamine dehydrogenase [Microtetraspora sp. NBRC 13810]|nr:UDP-N-acetyl-D-glucosamine dehydrogenase [Microtetraspora sp. NBRC 13810]
MIGQGHVGLPLAMRAVEAGYEVVGVDADEQHVKRLLDGGSFVEGVPDARLAAALEGDRYRATTDVAVADGFDVCVIAVPTPLRSGARDLSGVSEAARAIAPLLGQGATVILESTVHPGTTDDVLRGLLEEPGLRAGEDFHLGYSPERSGWGDGRWPQDATPRIVAGLDEASLDRIGRFYVSLTERVVPVSGIRVAELAGLLEDTFRHVNMALVNELAVLAAEQGVDVWEAIEAACAGPFGRIGFRPGPGTGGHPGGAEITWPVKNTVGRGSRLIELADAINTYMPEHVVGRITRGLNHRRLPLRGSRVLLLGLSRAANSGDLRDSGALAVADSLHGLGAHVRAADPYADPDRVPGHIELVRLTPEELAEADAVAVLTDHDCFDYEMAGQAGRYVFDARDRCSGPNVERL